jgi:hypothetical protein
MVAIDPNSTLNDYYIHVRESMIKFESDDWNLEICELARPSKIFIFSDDYFLIHEYSIV